MTAKNRNLQRVLRLNLVQNVGMCLLFCSYGSYSQACSSHIDPENPLDQAKFHIKVFKPPNLK
jgi:hypothetical protein